MIKRCLQTIVFSVLAVLMILWLADVCRYKGKTWNFTRGFWEEPDNTLDLVCIGSSHSYCSWNPNVAQRATGISSYSFGSPSQPVEASYAFIKEVFRHQRPKIILLETFTLQNADSERPIARLAAHNAIDLFDFGPAKAELIESMQLSEGRESYYFDLLQYHSRWKELGMSDFLTQRSRQPNRGYQQLEKTVPVNYAGWEADKVTWDSGIDGYLAAWLDRIHRYVKDRGAELVVYTAPFNMNNAHRRFVRALRRFFDRKGIRYYNLTDRAMGLEMDGATDFYDDKDGHLNAKGAAKMTRFLARRLMDDGLLASERP